MQADGGDSAAQATGADGRRARRRVVPVALFVFFASVYVLPSTIGGGIAQLEPRTHSIQGFLVVRVPLARGEEPETPLAGLLFAPEVTVTLENVGARSADRSVRTDLSGRFAFSGEVAGRYRVCWSGRGFVRACNAPFDVGDHVHLPLLRIAPVRRTGLTTIVGRVRLADGSVPRALDPLAGVNSFAVVGALDANRRPVTDEVPVNNNGEFIVPAVRAGNGLVVVARSERVSRTQELKPAALRRPFTRIALTLPNTPPESNGIVSSTPSGGARWTAAPGETVSLTVRGADRDDDALTYRWVAAPGAEQGPIEGATASFRLPRARGEYQFGVVISDGRGGYVRDGITITVGPVRFAGIVRGTNARAVVGAQVEVNGVTATTDPGGRFELSLEESARYLLTIRHPAYALVSHVYDVGTTGGRWTLTRASVVTADPTREIEARNERIRSDCPGAPRRADACPPGIGIRIPPQALVDENGKPPDGPVSIALATPDLDAPDDLPGDRVAENGERVRPIVPLGGAFVEISRGETRYDLAPGVEAELLIPIPRSAQDVPEQLQLFSYDEESGRWTEEGVATRRGEEYVARVGHLSTFASALYTSGPTCLRLESTLMPDKFGLEVTWPVTLIGPGGRQFPATVHEFFNVTDNGRQRFHVIPNLPLNTPVRFTAYEPGSTTVIQLLAPGATPGAVAPAPTITGNTGPTPQSPPAPSPPFWPYSACARAVELSPFTVGVARPNPLINTFFYGLYSFQAVNLNEVDPMTAAAVRQTTAEYYATIDPATERSTLTAFKNKNGFSSGGVVGAQYANSGDLGFGRDMQCRKAASGDVACYVTNYGDRFTDDTTDAIDAMADARNPGTRSPVATVAMEYSPIEAAGGSPGTAHRVVKFYVYNAAGARVGEADLDGFGARPVPALCMVCHGGKFPRSQTATGRPAFVKADPGSADLDARFIPFDLRSFTLPSANVPGVGFVDFKSSQQAAFKALNQSIVAATGVPAEPLEVISRMYTPTGGAPGSSPTQIENFATSGWLGGTPRFAAQCELILDDIAVVRAEIRDLQNDLSTAAPGQKGRIAAAIKAKLAEQARLGNLFAACVAANPVPTVEEELYDGVVAASCRTCHLSLAPRVAGASISWERSQDFVLKGGFLQALVCRTHYMPHAIATHNRFWLSRSPNQPRLLHQFFNDGLVAPMTCIQP